MLLEHDLKIFIRRERNQRIEVVRRELVLERERVVNVEGGRQVGS